MSDCDTQACWDGALKAVSQNVPVLTGEMGDRTCARLHRPVHGVGGRAGDWLHSAWAWNPQACNTFPALITNFDGTPTAFGQGLKDHLATFPALH